MNMNAPETEEAFLEKAREALQASTAALSAEVLARLRESRRLAVEAASHPGPAWRRHGWVPAGALAAVFVAVLGSALWLDGGQPTPAPGSSFAAGANEDMPIVLSNDDSLDMYADMDFYQWMATEDQPAVVPDDSEDSDDQDDDDTGVGG